MEKIYDKVYGKEKIKEPVLIELINSDSIQRLKGISQFGMPDEYYHLKTFSRKEHSIGVLILLRRMRANLEEQVAGLLHDVSHTALESFSGNSTVTASSHTNENIPDKEL